MLTCMHVSDLSPTIVVDSICRMPSRGVLYVSLIVPAVQVIPLICMLKVQLRWNAPLSIDQVRH